MGSESNTTKHSTAQESHLKDRGSNSIKTFKWSTTKLFFFFKMRVCADSFLSVNSYGTHISVFLAKLSFLQPFTFSLLFLQAGLIITINRSDKSLWS